jgi:hypothetical protein
MLDRLKTLALFTLTFTALVTTSERASADGRLTARLSQEFAFRGEGECLGGNQFHARELRYENAFESPAPAERHIHNLDRSLAQVIKLIPAYTRGANLGCLKPEGRLDGFACDGQLEPEMALRQERFLPKSTSAEWPWNSAGTLDQRLRSSRTEACVPSRPKHECVSAR